MYLLYPPSTHLCEVQVRFVSIKHLCPKKATGHLPVMVILIKQWDHFFLRGASISASNFAVDTRNTLEIFFRLSMAALSTDSGAACHPSSGNFLFWRGMV